MNQKITHIALVIDECDIAIKFYAKKLKFTLIEDTILSATKRWVHIAPEVRQNVVYYWQELQMKSRPARLEIKLADMFFYFCPGTIFKDTFKICWTTELE